MKKLLALTLTIVLAFSCLPLAAGAAAFSNGDMALTFGGAPAAENTHYTYEPYSGGQILTLLVPGEYTLSGTGTELQVVASATNITLTLRDAHITGIADSRVRGVPETYGTLYFPHGGTLRAEGAAASVTGGAGAATHGTDAVYTEGPLAVEVGAAALTLTGGACTSADVNSHGSGGGLSGMSSVHITLDGGAFTAEGGASSASVSGGLDSSSGAVTIAYGSRGGSVSLLGGILRASVRGAFGASVGSLMVSGAGTLRAEGAQGLTVVGGNLDLGGAAVTAVGTTHAGIAFLAGATLRGNGSLDAKGGSGSAVGLPGISANGDLILAFTGDLESRGCDGVPQLDGNGVVTVAGDGLFVWGALTVAAEPRSLRLYAGTHEDSFAVRILSTDNNGAPLLTNSTNVPITVDNVNNAREIIWTQPTKNPPAGGEWVTVWPPEVKKNSHTGR